MKTLFYRVNTERAPWAQIATRIVASEAQRYLVRKEAVGKEAERGLELILHCYDRLKNASWRFFDIPKLVSKTRSCLTFEFIEGQTLARIIESCIAEHDRDAALRWIDVHASTLKKFPVEAAMFLTPRAKSIFGTQQEPPAAFLQSCIPPGIPLDLPWENMLVRDDGSLVLFDFEWSLSVHVSRDYFTARNVLESTFGKRRFFAQCYAENECFLLRDDTMIPHDWLRRYELLPQHLYDAFYHEVQFQRFVHGAMALPAHAFYDSTPLPTV